jgi:hypothetical protein
VLCAQLVLLHRKVFAVPLDRLVGKPLLAAVPAVVAMLGLGHYSGLVAGIVAALLFMAGLLATRYISRAEWEPLTKPVMRVVSQVF